MNNKLPSDLREAESNVYESIQSYFSSNSQQSFLSINLRFEGLRINPIIFRLSNNLTELKYDNILLWADAGGAALASGAGDARRGAAARLLAPTRPSVRWSGRWVRDLSLFVSVNC